MLSEEQDQTIREALERWDIYEAWRVIAEYKCLRRGKLQDAQEVHVRVFDGGPSVGHRYWFEVTAPGARETGPLIANNMPDLVAAGFAPHWDTLDSEAMNDLD